MAAYKALSAGVGAVQSAMGGPKQQGPPHWQVEQFDCMGDTNVCLQTVCCPFCTEANVITMRERGVADMDLFTCLGACCLEVLTRGFFGTALVLAVRRQLVQRYGIQDEPYCQSVITNICAPCSFCQIQREMALRGEHPGGIFAKAPGAEGGIGAKIGAAAHIGAASAGLNPWGSGLFQCAGAEDCLDSWCLSCCTLAHMSNRIDAGRTQLIPKDAENKMDPATCCGAWCCMPQFHYAMRRETIDRYGITEPHLVSFVLMAFCPCCSLAQVRREMGYRGEWPAGILLKDAPAKPA